MGEVNVRGMLKSISMSQFLDWHYYDEIEPFDERLAAIVKALWDIGRDTKIHPKPFSLFEFLGHYGDEVDRKEKKPDWRALKQVAELMVAAWNTKAK